MAGPIVALLHQGQKSRSTLLDQSQKSRSGHGRANSYTTPPGSEEPLRLLQHIIFGMPFLYSIIDVFILGKNFCSITRRIFVVEFLQYNGKNSKIV